LILLRVGFTLPHAVTSGAVRSYRTLSPLPVPFPAIGGLLSAALSVGSRPPGITWHSALWSPDFPRRCSPAHASEDPRVQRRDCLADSPAQFTTARRAGGNYQPTNRRALANSRDQPPASPHSGGAQEFCTLRNTRSGCGIINVTRPSAEQSPLIPSGEPFGLAG